MLKRFLYLIIFFSGFGLLALGQPALAESSSSAVKNSFAENSEPDFLPPDQAFKLNIEATSANSLEAQFTIVPGYYLYKTIPTGASFHLLPLLHKHNFHLRLFFQFFLFHFLKQALLHFL